MKILKFTLEGRTAFFKKPDVNTYFYFTYGNIHKIALLGIFGSILGIGGYNQMSFYNSKNPKKQKVFPEFYEKLRSIKIAIVPNNPKGFIDKKVQFFNNTVGYASKEQGGNLIVKEQWLENSSWHIYVQIIDETSEQLSDYIMNKKSIYTPYLGKNDHLADIKDAHLYSADEITIMKNVNKIDSLFIKDQFSIESFDEEEEEDDYIDPFKYEENLPVYLNEETNLYEFETFIFTNMILKQNKVVDIIKIDNKNILFF